MEDPGMTVRLVHSQSRSRHFRLGTSQITTRVTIFCQTHRINIICSEERVLSYIVSEWLIGFFWHERLNICLFEDQLREATKNGKKFHTCCELSQKMENPPPPISQQFQTILELENRCFFAIIKILWMRGIDKNKIGDLFKVKL